MSDHDGADAWNLKRKEKAMGMSNVVKRQKVDQLWRKIEEKEREIREELYVCKRQARKTDRYRHLISDMAKLKAEYEKEKGGGSFNPMSLEHGERTTTRKIVGDLTGKTGPESHARLED